MPSIFFLGDSHARYFQQASKRGLFAPYDCFVCEVRGATAVGLKNPDSFTRAAKSFTDFLTPRKKQSESIVVLHLGEVDCGILIWSRSKKNNTTIATELKRSVTAYLEFIETIKSLGFNNIVITGATAPTINDTDHVGGIVTERRSLVSANQLERTKLTKTFNSELRKQAAKREIPFVDIWNRVIDKATNVAHTKFRNKVISDHHMDNDMAAVAWAAELNPVLWDLSPITTTPFKAVSKTRTFAKALAANSTNLHESHKIELPANSVVSGQVIGRLGHTLQIANLKIDTKKVDPSCKYIYEPHFEKVI